METVRRLPLSVVEFTLSSLEHICNTDPNSILDVSNRLLDVKYIHFTTILAVHPSEMHFIVQNPSHRCTFMASKPQSPVTRSSITPPLEFELTQPRRTKSIGMRTGTAFFRPLPEGYKSFLLLVTQPLRYSQTPPCQMVRWAIIDDSDPRLVYTGNWNFLQTPVNAQTPEYNGTVHATNDPTATISFNFTGTVIDFFGTIDAPATYGYPNASFTITPLNTGTPLQHLNETGYVTEVQDMLIATSHLEFFKSGNLPLGNHTMTVVADGVQDGGPTFYFDFLRVAIPSNGTFDSIIVDDAETDWVYTTNWIKGSHVGEYLDTWHSTPLDGGSAQLTFYGSNISVYGAFGGQYDPDTPLAYINVDNEPRHTVIPRNITDQLLGTDVALRNQLVFATSGMPDLGETPRTLTISIPFISPEPTPRPIISSPSWFVDYAIYGPYTTTSTTTSPPTGSGSSTATSTNASTPPPSSSPNSGAIAGGVVGALAGVTLIIVAILLWRRKNRGKPRPMTAVQEEYPASIGQPLPYVLDIYHDSPSTPSAWNGGIYGTKGAERVTSSGTGSSHGARSPTAVSSGGGSGQSPIGRGSGSGSATGTLMRELDGGVRLATSSTFGSEVLPPTYAPYDRT